MSRPSLRSILIASVVGLSLCFGSSAGAAEFGPIQLDSKSAKEQANFAREPALSADGHYVAFRAELGGRTGIFRKDLSTGALTTVVEALQPGNETEVEAPSISAEGRYVSFTTTRPLDPAADPEADTTDVYVADLAATPPTYRLASGIEGQRMSGSSSAAPRVALSADGGKVAFINDEQVYVRDLVDSAPVLISARRDPITGAMTTEPAPKGAAWTNSGAALSADGKVVAWVGEDLPDQVPVFAVEEEAIERIEADPTTPSEVNKYFEPLWREVPSAGAATDTRRIVGGGDPLAPGCAGEASEAACQGPFPELIKNHKRPNLRGAEGVGWGTGLPQLDADGMTVAVIGSPEEGNDIFLVDMAPGLSRIQAVHQLTRWTNPDPGAATAEAPFEDRNDLIYTGPIKQCAISPDGTHIAFTTLRQAFSLNPPVLVTPRPVAPPVAVELYQVDLGGQTIERVTPGPGTSLSAVPGVSAREIGTPEALVDYGEAPLGASGPSYSDDDRTLAFASSAFNLVTGDANEASDVFTVETPPPAPVKPSTISPRPSAISVLPSWRLTVHAVSRPNGAVRIVADVPGTGTLRAQAKSRFGPKPRPRKVSTAQRGAEAPGVLRLDLKLSSKLRRLARQKGGLYATLTVQFSGPGGKPLVQQLVARFRVHRPVKKKGAKG